MRVNAKGMGDAVTWQGDATVAQYMWGEIVEQGQAGNPGSDGASPYLSASSSSRSLPSPSPICARYAGTPTGRHAHRPTRRYANTPIRQYANTPIRQYANTPTRRPAVTFLPVSPRAIGLRISQRDFDSRFSQRLSPNESVRFSPSRHWRSSSMLSGPIRANTWGDSQST